MNWSIHLTEVPMPEEDVQAVIECLRSGWLSLGPRTAAFERALSEWTGARHAVAVSSGTAALHLCCQAAGLGPGDEAIVPSLSFVASANAPRYCGATTVLADVVSPSWPLLDPEDVERRITPRTKAVVAVHMFGYTADMDALRALCAHHGLVLIEDAAQAIGATLPSGVQAGVGGDLGAFSFFSKKALTTGEGGMVTTADDDYAAAVRSLRSHAMTSGTWARHRGHSESYDIIGFGNNYRMDEPRAALGLSRLPRLSGEIEQRREAAVRYRELLDGVEGVDLVFDDEAVTRASHLAFPVLLPSLEARSRVQAHLVANGIQSTFYPAIHALTAYREQADTAGLTRTAEAAERHLSLPLYAGMGEDTIAAVCDAVRDGLAAH